MVLSGGVSTIDDLRRRRPAAAANVVGVIVGRALYEDAFTLAEAKAVAGGVLTKRIIPCLDVRDGRVVKGVNFVGLRDAGDPVELAARYDREGADELVFLDITASHERRRDHRRAGGACAEQVFIPFTIGGGLRSVEDVRHVLAAGADKVTLNTAAVEDPDLVRRCAERFGAQCIVVAVDAKRRTTGARRWEVYIHGGRTPTGLDALEWAVRAAELGAGEFMLTSMDRDGTLDGYDLELTRAVARAVDVPVIASGGVGTLGHLAQAFGGRGRRGAGRVDLPLRHHTIAEAKDFLAAPGSGAAVRGGHGRAGGARSVGPIVGVTARQRIELAGLRRTSAALAAAGGARLVVLSHRNGLRRGRQSAPGGRRRLAGAKGRAAGKPLQVIFPTLEVLRPAPAPAAACALRSPLLPGPVTLACRIPQASMPAARRGLHM